MGLIYKIVCEITGKCYVGQTTKTLNERIKWHLYEVKYFRRKYPIYNAIRKYGWDSFKVEVLEDNIPLEFLNEREIFWTNKFNALFPGGYVLVAGGQNYQIFSEETRKKIGKASKNRKKSEESKKKISGSKNVRARTILCYDLNDNFIKEYDCIINAAKELKLHASHISRVCRKKCQKTGKYKFQYK